MTRIQVRRGTAEAWTAANPVLSAGEYGVETDTSRMKIGNGSTDWATLPYYLSWSNISGKPAVIAAGATAEDARDAIGAGTGTSDLVLGLTADTAKPGDWVPDPQDIVDGLGYTPQDAAEKGAANGYASLDEAALVPASQLPSYVDDVLEFDDEASFPVEGERGKIYVAIDVNRVFRWSGSTYIEIVSSPGSSDSIQEGSVNLYFTDARADARVAAAVGVTVQAHDSALDGWAAKTVPAGVPVGDTDTQTLSGKTLTNPTVTNYTESVTAIGVVGTAHTLVLTGGTVQTATLTAGTACVFTMPTPAAGKSFVLMLRQDGTGGGTATFDGVKWGQAGIPTITADPDTLDILSFVADGTSWFGSYTQGYAL